MQGVNGGERSLMGGAIMDLRGKLKQARVSRARGGAPPRAGHLLVRPSPHTGECPPPSVSRLPAERGGRRRPGA